MTTVLRYAGRCDHLIFCAPVGVKVTLALKVEVPPNWPLPGDAHFVHAPQRHDVTPQKDQTSMTCFW
jgi:hypothetical protein